MTTASDDRVPTVEQTMSDIRGIFAQMQATNQLIIERVITLAEL
jgi:hypothetical protein